MQTIKVVGKRGQISVGKALAGQAFVLQELPGGDLLLKRAVLVPFDERWLHEPAMKAKLAQAEKWMQQNSPTSSDLAGLAKKLGT
ncbi:MAG: hypothetical protein JO142_11765 [Burkholderiales bacterium]|nr:hypothetical protein [Roseateles sp.]MBV8658491.1 hypothetical protein [Burkholderiales bacterium]